MKTRSFYRSLIELGACLRSFLSLPAKRGNPMPLHEIASSPSAPHNDRVSVIASPDLSGRGNLTETTLVEQAKSIAN